MFSTRMGRPNIQELEMTKLRGHGEFPFVPEQEEADGTAAEWFSFGAVAADLYPPHPEPAQNFWGVENIGLVLWVVSSIALAAVLACLSVWGS